MKYFLSENRMGQIPDECVARVTQQETVSFEELIKMATRRGLTLTDTELTGAINELTYTIIDMLNSGKAVETPFARYRLSISGLFTNKDDVFDPNRHHIRINCLAGRSIKIDTKSISLEKVKYTSTSPFIERLLDYSSLEENDSINPGGAAEISGELLKIDTDDPDQGIYFLQNGTATKVSVIIRNLPSDLIFNIPATLTAGQYQLEIRNKTNKKDKTLKTFLFSSLLTVK